jgi:hypothetical protein
MLLRMHGCWLMQLICICVLFGTVLVHVWAEHHVDHLVWVWLRLSSHGWVAWGICVCEAAAVKGAEESRVLCHIVCTSSLLLSTAPGSWRAGT